MNFSRRVYDDVSQLIGSRENPTPLVRLRKLPPPGSGAIFTKLEWMNPFGSIKDRAAAYLIRDLEQHGGLSTRRGIVEPTSGNTGIALAMVAAMKGYRMILVMPEHLSVERRQVMRAFGARLVLTALRQLHDTDKKRALVSMCVGGGQGGAAILEAL